MNALARYLGILRADPRYFARMALVKSRAALPLDYLLLRSGRAFPPIQLSIEVTHRCNLACHMCDLYGGAGAIDAARSRREDPGRPFDVGLLEALLDSFGLIRPVISFGGGEPLMHPRLAEMVALASRRGFVCTVTTNGTLLDRHAADLVRAGLDSIVLSIDGPEEIHDSVRGVEGAFARAAAGAAALRAARAGGRPRLRINCTISSRNFAHLGRVPAVAAALGAESVVFSHLWFWDREIVEAHNRAAGDLCPAVEQNVSELDRIDPGVMIAELEKVRASRSGLMIKFLPDLDAADIRRYYTEHTAPVKRVSCRAVWLSAFVMPDGEVLPCLDYTYGNLRERPFRELWNGARARAFRRRLRAVGIFPGCVRCCGLYAY
ncbi:MAG: radical SAM protein [bacterium]|nr:radical SAM protein [bacterium]